jgi:hypothetical protein
MWWNLVARTPAEIEAAVAGWREGRFGTVPGYHDAALAARPSSTFGHPARPDATSRGLIVADLAGQAPLGVPSRSWPSRCGAWWGFSASSRWPTRPF